MAKFNAEQAVAVLAINQVINEWGDELDRNDGLSIRSANVLSKVTFRLVIRWRMTGAPPAACSRALRSA